MPEIAELVRGSSSNLSLRELLKRRITDLLGVSPAAATSLQSVGIGTIFDLGTSHLFRGAMVLAEISKPWSASSRFRSAPGDLLKSDAVYASIDDIPQLPITSLRGLKSADAAAIESSLNVSSVRDLAYWPPYIAARRLLGDSVGASTSSENLDADELRPRFGAFPSERVYYSTLALLEMLGEGGDLTDLAGTLSLNKALANSTTVARPAVGALVTLAQSWFCEGVTLGQMLHSLALAPGEATRVAVIDWSRRTNAAASEDISEAEQLNSQTSHSRALSEVQNAVGRDLETGGSRSSSSSISASDSTSWGSSSGLLSGFWGGGSEGGSSQSARTMASSASSGWSLGTRSVLASLTQDVNDRTEQHSASVRSRRATAVREVSQEEHEQVSTRVVANYNHMHALTVQYYEVVQIYRTITRLHRIDRCLFVPLTLLDFSQADGWNLVERFRGSLLTACLNARTRELLLDDATALELSPTVLVRFADDVAEQRRRKARIIGGITGTTALNPIPSPSGGPKVWDAAELAMAARILNRPLARPGSDSLFIPDDTELIALTFDGLSVQNARIDRLDVPDGQETFRAPGDPGRLDFPGGVPMVGLDSIHLSKGTEAPQVGSMVLVCSYLGRRFTLPAVPIELGPGTALTKVLSIRSDKTDRRRELLAHLQQNRDYYSQAVFRGLDSFTITQLLSGYAWNGKPLIDQVEPIPIQVAGNYLVLRAPIENEESVGLSGNITWGEYCERRGLKVGGDTDERVIPIPTGGVFAEAVLGRSNSAEKLDITRFWNWQDSPIPLSPPEIAAVQTGSRGTSEPLVPSQFSSPVLNVLNPVTLPEPTRLDAVLNTLSNINFRDMSGLAGSQGLTGSGMSGTLAAATEAGKLASENMRMEAQKEVAMAAAVSDLAKAAIAASAGIPVAGSTGKPVGISEKGAAINHGQSLDARNIDRGGGSPDDIPVGPTPPNRASDGRVMDTSAPGAGGGAALSSREAAYADQAVFGFSPGAVNSLEPFRPQLPNGMTLVPAKWSDTGHDATEALSKLKSTFEQAKELMDEVPDLKGASEAFKKAIDGIEVIENVDARIKQIEHLQDRIEKMWNLVGQFKKTDRASAKWLSNPEKVENGIAWALESSELISGLRIFDYLLPEPLKEYFDGLFDSVKVYTKELTTKLKERIDEIDNATPLPGTVTYELPEIHFSGICDPGGLLTEHQKDIIDALDVDEPTKAQLFRSACELGFGDAVREVLRLRLDASAI